MTASKLHIVHIVSNELYVAGIPNLVLGLATSAPLSKYKHSVIGLHGIQGELVKHFRAAGVSLHSCYIKWPPRVRYLPAPLIEWMRAQFEKTFVWRLAHLLKKNQADVVHVHTPRRIDLLTESVVNRCNIPLVWSIHGENIYYASAPDAGYIQSAVQTLLNTRCGWIAPDSTFLAQNFLKHHPDVQKILKVVHAGADTERFKETLPRDPAWRKHWKIPDNAVIFGSCGRLAPVKGYDVFVQAASLLLRRGVFAHFCISGKGPIYDQLMAQISELGLTEYFHLLGFQEDLPYTYSQFDVFVLPSRSEGFPLSLIEALASGLPCIASDVSGVRDMFGAESGGLIFPPASAEALADVMQQMLDPDIRAKYAAGSRLRGQLYSFENCGADFLSLYTTQERQ